MQDCHIDKTRRKENSNKYRKVSRCAITFIVIVASIALINSLNSENANSSALSPLSTNTNIEQTTQLSQDSQAYLTRGAHYNYFGGSDCPFTINGVVGYCAQPILPAPENGVYAKEACPSTASWRLDDIASILYYGYGGPGFDESMWPSDCCGQAWTSNLYRACTHVMVADRVYAQGSKSVEGTTTEFQDWAYWNLLGVKKGTGEWVNQNAMAFKMASKGTPYGFKETVFAINTTSTASQTIIGYEWVGDFETTKQSSNASISNDNSCYSLNGSIYSIYSDQNCTNKIAEITSNADGYMKSSSFGRCTLYVKETSAPEGYSLDPTIYSVDIKPSETSKLNGGLITDCPQNDSTWPGIKKVDKETDEASPLGSGTLEGAQFTIKFWAQHNADTTSTPTRKWVIETDSNGEAQFNNEYLVEGDNFYYSNEGKITFPLGTITIEETKAPEGYLRDENVYVQQITSQGTLENVNLLNESVIDQQSKRGDIEFVKVDADSMKRLSEIPFLITSKTSGESHVIVTDENGHVNTSNSWTSHSLNTNANNEALMLAEDKTCSVDETKLTSDAGVWFGTNANGSVAPINDNLCALPYDTYTIEELEVEKNKDLNKVSIEVTIKRDNVTLDLGTLDDNPIDDPIEEPPQEQSETINVFPQTGDLISFLLLLVCIATFISLVSLLIFKKKREMRARFTKRNKKTMWKYPY